MTGYGGCDGLYYRDVDYLNREENLQKHAALFKQLRLRLEQDPETAELYEDKYFHQVNCGEYCDCIFPFKGAWYVINNGSSREHNEAVVNGPFSTDQLIHFIRQSAFREERDPSLFRDVLDDFLSELQSERRKA